MDKQKLIGIAKDQLKGGIGAEQVRELLTYRGVEANDVEEIMQAALSDATQPGAAEGGDVIAKTDEAIEELLPNAVVPAEYVKKEWSIIMLSVIGLVAVVAIGSAIYYFYF